MRGITLVGYRDKNSLQLKGDHEHTEEDQSVAMEQADKTLHVPTVF